MLLNMYSVCDVKSSFYTPFFEANDEVAIRNFKTLLNSTGLIADYPDDFSLYAIGCFDTNDGFVVSKPEIIMIARGMDLKED